MIKNHNTSRLRRIFGCNLLLLIFTLPLTAQDLSVTGRVTDGNLPISGASIIIKNTMTGTVSDFDGRYSITAKATDTLEVSYLGYTSVTVPIQGRRAIDVTVQETVTVTGTVTNAETGKPIEWVSVYDNERVYGHTYTDKNGSYKIEIPIGTNVVFARHWYHGKTHTVDSIHYNVALKPLPKGVQEEMDRRARSGGSE